MAWLIDLPTGHNDHSKILTKIQLIVGYTDWVFIRAFKRRRCARYYNIHKKTKQKQKLGGGKKKVQHANIEEITNSSFAFAFSSSYTTDMQKLNPT